MNIFGLQFGAAKKSPEAELKEVIAKLDAAEGAHSTENQRMAVPKLLMRKDELIKSVGTAKPDPVAK